MEYKIEFALEARDEPGAFLRALPGFVNFEEERGAYIYREEGNLGTLPSAEIRIEAGGLYFCDYGVSRQFIGQMVTKLVGQFGRVSIENYEP